jgi:hypothetical protein
MNIEIEKAHVEALVERFPAHSALAAQLRFSDRVEVDLAHLTGDELDFLEDRYRREGPEQRGRCPTL